MSGGARNKGGSQIRKKRALFFTKRVLFQSFAEYLTINPPIRALCWPNVRGNEGDEGRVWLGLTSVWFSITTK